MHIGLAEGAPFAFAGLWTTWGPKDGEQLETFTIITGEPNELVAPIHNRMPVMLSPADYARWLDVEQQDAEQLFRPYPAAAMVAYPVSTRVNSPKNDEAALIEAVAAS